MQAIKAAFLLFYQYAKANSLRVNGKFLKGQIRVGLSEESVVEILKSLPDSLTFSEEYSTLVSDIDFQLEYDVPPEERREVFAYLETICRQFKLKAKDVIKFLQAQPVSELEALLQEDRKTVKTAFKGKFVESTAITDDPVLAKVEQAIPSVGILNQYRSDFEKEVAILLRLLHFNAIKYQGQLADKCTKPQVMKFFENNPDILVINGIESLFECKSIGEWHTPLAGSEKGVQKEFVLYQQYMPEVRPNSAVIVYEGSVDPESYALLRALLADAPNVVFVTKNFLINCMYKPLLRDRLLRVMKEPRKYKPDDRILTA